MSTNSRWWFADLVLALILAGIGGYAAYAGLGGRTRVALVLPLVVFLPGYVFISALFPEGGQNGARAFGDDEDGAAYAVGGPERVGLAVTVSVAVVPMVAAVANFTPWGIRLRPILVGILAFTAFFTLIALARRWRVSPERRYSPGLPGLLFGSTGRHSSSTTTTVLNVGIVISFLLVASTVGFAMLNPPQGEQFTEFYVEGQKIDSSSNTLYQPNLGDGVTVNVGNREGERTKYTVVAVLERVEDGSITEQNKFDEQQVTVRSGRTKKVTLEGDQSISGDNVRVRLFLYKGDASGNPYHSMRFWLSSQSPPPQEGNSDNGDNSAGESGDGNSDDNGGNDNGGNDNSDEGEQTTQPPETSTTTTTSTPSGTTQTTQPPETSTTTTTSTPSGTTQTTSTSGTSTTGTTQTTQAGSTTTTTTTDDGGFP
ncbi:DUF1616 domain-containing protein [Haladaptatus sp. DFWS20]|uniref:DUF1616 domain-containing protein n=1 Tax=Haladaptatus sp. DFWS20 TaxID=3403467 RepID=UPI003EBB5C2E